MKKIISLLLALLMTFSLTACAKAAAPAEAAEATAAPEVEVTGYAYTAEYTPLTDKSENYISPRIYTEDGFYASTYEQADTAAGSAAPEYNGQDPVYKSRLYFFGFDGSVKRLEAYESVPKEENTEDKIDFSSGSELCGLALTADGGLVAVENCYSSWYDGPASLTPNDLGYWDHQQYKNDYYIRALDSNGAELSRAVITLNEGEYIYANSMQTTPDGALVICSDKALLVFGMDGVRKAVIESEGYIDKLVRFPDGEIAAGYYGDNGNCIAFIDFENSVLGEEKALPEQAYSFTVGSGDHKLYYTSGNSFYGYELESGQSEKIFSWADCDINSGNVGPVGAMPDGSFVAVINTSYTSDDGQELLFKVELVRLKKVPADSLAQKKTLTFGAQYIDYQVMDMIVRFNRSNPQYRIEVLDYSEYNTAEDYNAGRTRLLNDILSGSAPDIIDLSNLPYEQLAAKGCLEDLYPCIDADAELSREDFFPSVLSALEVDGALCSTGSGFSVDAVIGAASAVGEKSGWTYDEMDAFLAAMPEDSEIFDVYTSRESVLRSLLQLDMDKYLDWSEGKCSFDSGSFEQLLNFAARFPGDKEVSERSWSEGDSSIDRIRGGKQLLLQTGFYSFEDMNYNRAYFGEDISFVGYPSADGRPGNMLNIIGRYAMSGNCAYKDAAWQFLREFFTADYQREFAWCFSTRLDVYGEREAQAMTPRYEKDENGEILLDGDGNPIESPAGSMSVPGGAVEQFYALTETQAEQIRQVISESEVLAVYDFDYRIFEIVLDCAQDFFDGEKTAAETAALTQNTVSEYISR